MDGYHNDNDWNNDNNIDDSDIWFVSTHIYNDFQLPQFVIRAGLLIPSMRTFWWRNNLHQNRFER